MYPLNIVETLKYLVSILIVSMRHTLIPFFSYQSIISVFRWSKRKEDSADSYAPVNRSAVAAFELLNNTQRGKQKNV